MRIRFMNPFSPLCSWNFWEPWTSEPGKETDSLSYLRAERWRTGGRLCLWPLSSPTLLFARERSCMLHAWLTARGLLLDCILFFFKGVSLRESLCASCVSCESSLEPDLSWNAKSLIQADVLLWPKNLGKRHCDNKVASYLTAFLLK